MNRVLVLFLTTLAVSACDGGNTSPSDDGGERSDRLSGTYRAAQRCTGLGPAGVDFTARAQGSNYYLLVRGEGEQPVYAAVDRLEVPPSWNSDQSDVETSAEGLPLHEWHARLTKEAGWLKDGEGRAQLPDDARLAYDADNDRFFFVPPTCEGGADSADHIFQHQDQRLVLHELNVALAGERDRMYRDAGQRYIEKRRDYQGGSGAGGVTTGHEDRNQHLLNVAALMKADAEQEVPGLARLVAEHQPADAAAARRYHEELPAYLRAAARAHARWYIDAAEIRLDWFHGTYPDGEAAIKEGMAELENAYLQLAEQ
ncbi:hypothetical protein [Alloalcanivorax marinus]|uniref:hypothetical protein n=1 Tax=Alloalcanivorax marinus TaxID=1177169 RepID=UPI0019333C1A|nr:hypothetical protein [Alloalcanivorax marinus]MBL7250943.1 hypothetical protein [Alloalcanivorax marinus]